MIPLSFVIQDMTTEIYGYRVSRQLVQLSLLILIGVVLFLKITTHFPIPNHPNVDFAYDAVFNTIPRHLLALLVAMVCGNLFNDYLLSKLKTQLKGKYMAARFIFSTMAGEALLQLAGTTVAWVGNLRFTTEILPFVLFSYCYKIIFSALITPVNVMICQSLKKLENRDTFDNNISYNPFSIKTK